MFRRTGRGGRNDTTKFRCVPATVTCGLKAALRTTPAPTIGLATLSGRPLRMAQGRLTFVQKILLVKPSRACSRMPKPSVRRWVTQNSTSASILLDSILHLCKIVLHMKVTSYCNCGKGKLFLSCIVLIAFVVLSSVHFSFAQ